MWLWIALAVVVIVGLVRPFGSRLQATSLWAGKALAPPGSESSHPAGMQSAINDGWPSWIGLLTGIGPFVAGGIGFVHAWWAGVLALFGSLMLSEIVSRTSLVSPSVDRYLALFLDHANRRHADFVAEGDTLRADAAEELVSGLENLTTLYMGSGVPAPTIDVAQQAPHGDQQYLLRQHRYADVDLE